MTLTQTVLASLVERAEARWVRFCTARSNGLDAAARHHEREYNRIMRAVAYLRGR